MPSRPTQRLTARHGMPFRPVAAAVAGVAARRPAVGYLIAVASAGAAITVRLALAPFLGDHAQWLLFALAVMVSASFGGFGPGMVSTAASALLAVGYLLRPDTTAGQDPSYTLSLTLFGAVGGAISLLAHRLQEARGDAEAHAAAVQNQTAALRQSEERFRLLVDGVRDYALYMLDATGHVISWNAGAERLFGYAPADILGRSFSRFFPAADGAEQLADWELQTASAGGRCEQEGWRVRWDGTRFWAHGVLTAIRDERGQLLGYAKVTHDITEQKLLEDRLRSANEGLEVRVQERTAELEHANECLQAEVAARRAVEEGLRDSLAQIRTLQGIIPICGYCKRIRDDQDYWEQLEAYISAHTEARFSHGVCPHCAETVLKPQIEALKKRCDEGS